jgi:hypothetical protein
MELSRLPSSLEAQGDVLLTIEETLIQQYLALTLWQSNMRINGFQLLHCQISRFVQFVNVDFIKRTI